MKTETVVGKILTKYNLRHGDDESIYFEELNHEIQSLLTNSEKLKLQNERLSKALKFIFGEFDHDVPSSCYSTGPLTGDVVQDFLACPGCRAVALAESALNEKEPT